MKKAFLIHFALAAAILVTLGAAPAAAQTYDAEIDCGGTFSPGDSVPFTVRFEEQGFITHQISGTVAVTVPIIGQLTILNGNLTLGPNQDRAFNRNLALPMNAPNGNYQMSITADDGDLVRFDTCSFNVR